MEKTLPMFASVMHQAANVLCDAAINEQQFDKVGRIGLLRFVLGALRPPFFYLSLSSSSTFAL